MHIYFVRHGETEFNNIHRHQPDDAPLNELGRHQAEKVRDAVLALKPTHFITSTHTRAVETASIINEADGYELEYNELFRELERPERIQGKKHFGLPSLFYIYQWFFGFREGYWKKNGGESHKAFIDRIKAAKAYLESLPEDATVVVVSHSVFINFFIEHVCKDHMLSTREAFKLLMKITDLPNTAITHVSYNPDFGDGVCKWSVL